MKKKYFVFSLLLIVGIFQYVNATVWKVGTLRTYKMPSAVASLVGNGDTVNIDAGTYSDCATWNQNNLLLRGVGGMAHIKDVVCSGKGIWNFNGNNITTEYIEFSGATNPSQNGSGIRGQGGSFTVRYCYFHDNDDGILCNDPAAGTSDVLVEYCEFANNGYGDGYSHNMYIGNMNNFTVRYCYTHHAKIGHEIKSRANHNYILYNRITDETTGTASRNIDLPNGGLAVIIGNLIEQGPNTDNSNILGYGLEGLINPGPQDAYVINNTFVNNRSGGSFVQVQAGTGILKMANNIFAGTGALLVGTATILDSTTNWVTSTISSIGFVNVANYDYQLLSTAKVIGKGSNPGLAATYALTPVLEYVHNSNKRNRSVNGIIDIGAYEYVTPTNVLGVEQPLNSTFSLIDDILTINFHDKIFVLNIYDVTGKLVYSQEKNTSENCVVDISMFVKGVYIIQAVTARGGVYNQKMKF